MARFERARLERNAQLLREAWDIVTWDSVCYLKISKIYTAENIVFAAESNLAPASKGEFSNDGARFRNLDTGEEVTRAQELDLLVSHAR